MSAIETIRTRSTNDTSSFIGRFYKRSLLLELTKEVCNDLGVGWWLNTLLKFNLVHTVGIIGPVPAG